MPPPPWMLRWPRWLGALGLAGALALAAALLLGEVASEALWWRGWVACAAALLLGFPLSMFALWRNGERVPRLDAAGRPLRDPRGRPILRRVDLPGSRSVFGGLVLQSLALLVLVGLLLWRVVGPDS
jgi:hypothetical protein